MKRILLIFLLLLPLAAPAQQRDSFLRDLNDFFQMRSDKNYAKRDSSYIRRYPYIWDARIFNNTSGMHIVSEGNGSASLSTGANTRVGVSLGYRGVALSYSLALGRKMNFDLGLTSYGRFGFEFSLRGTSNLKGTIAMYGQPEREVKADDMTLLSGNLNLFYSFNKNFSYAAAMKQSEIQVRSAGSLIAAASWTVWDILGAGPDIISKNTSLQTLLNTPNTLYNRISAGVGYGYNLILGQGHWLMHASGIPMWSFIENSSIRLDGVKTKSKHPVGNIAFMGTARAGVYYRWSTRWSIGVSGILNQMMSANNFRTESAGYKRFGAQDWQARLSLCCRF